jgi:hypothetical protein
VAVHQKWSKHPGCYIIYVSLLEGMSLGKPTRWRGEHLLSTWNIGIEPEKNMRYAGKATGAG